MLALPFAGLVGGCSMVALKKDLKLMGAAASVSGTVERESPSSSPIFVALLEEQVSRDAVLDYLVLSEPGRFQWIGAERR